jgi:hypothetical protein
MLRKTLKNTIEKIGESYHHRNIFNASVEKPRWGKSENRHNHVFTLLH